MASRKCSERWRPVPDYEGIYSVSDRGRVRREAGSERCKVSRILKPGSDTQGYLHVRLCRNGRGKTTKVHHLVLDAFVGSRRKGRVCNHKNGTRDDNRLENLEWVTHRQNTWHQYHVLGDEPHARKKVTHLRLIQHRLSLGWSQQRIADDLGIGQWTVSLISRGKHWMQRVKRIG